VHSRKKLGMKTGARIFAILGMVVLVIVILVADADARGRTGSHRVGGYNSHGKGSHYVGGH
jgi:hypothetical protein